MADVQGTFYQATKVKVGTSPSSPGLISGTVPVNPVNPEGTTIGHVPVSIGGYPNGLTIDATTQVLNLEIGDGLGVDGYGRLEATGGGGGTPTAAVIGRYDIDTSGTTAPVGTKDIRYNNATQISATELFISDLTEDNIDVDLFLSLIKEGAALVIQDRDDHLNYQTYEVSGTPSFASATWTFPVTFKDSGGTGTTNFANNHKALLSTFSSGNGGISDAPNDGLAYTRKSLAWAQSSPYDLKQEGATDGQVLAWSTANSRFQPTTPSAGSSKWTDVGSGNIYRNSSVSIGQTDDPTNTLDVNGTARIRTVNNLGLTATRFAVLSATGVLSERTAAEMVSDLGVISNSVQTVSTGGTINNLATTGNTIVFTGASVTLTGIVALANGRELALSNFTVSNLTISGESASSTANNRFKSSFTLIIGQTAYFKYSTIDNRWYLVSGYFYGISDGLQSTNRIGFGRQALSNATLTTRSSTSDNTQSALYVDNSSSTRMLSVAGTGLVDIPVQLVVGSTTVPLTTYSFWVTSKGNTSSEGTIYLRNASGNLLTVWDGTGDQRSVGGATFGVQRIPTGRVEIRGRGTSTLNTLLLENSSGTVNVQFLDNGNIIYRDGSTWQLGTTTGTKIGTATNQKLSFWNKTPIIQPTNGIAGAALVGGGGTTITDTDTFGGYTVAQLAAILINTGLTA